MVENNTEGVAKKKSLSKYGAFNQSISTSRNNDSDEEDYGRVEGEEGGGSTVTKKILKKSLSRYGSHSVEKMVPVKENDSDEEYGNYDPSFKPEKVAYTSKGELVVIPENPTPKGMKKTLSKYGTPSSLPQQKTPTSVFSGNDSDEDYGALETTASGQKKIKKSLSKYKTDMVETQLNFEPTPLPPVKSVDSDDENYGEIDRSFQPVPVAKTSSGVLVVPPDPTQKHLKKTLSKYGNSPAKELVITPAKVEAKPSLQSSNNLDGDSDEEYGAVDASFLDSAKATQRKSLKSVELRKANEEREKEKSQSRDYVDIGRSPTTESESSTASQSGVKALIAKIEKQKVGH